MQSFMVIFLISIFLCTDVLAGIVFRCTDPANNTTVFSDRPCQYAPSFKVKIPTVNQIRGITQYERTLLDSLKTSKNRKKAGSRPGKRVKPNQKIHCIRNQLRIDEISLRLKQGYKSRKYNEYHDKLRLYKKYRSQHCV